MVDVLIAGPQGPTTNPRGDYSPSAPYYLADQAIGSDQSTYQCMVPGPVTGVDPVGDTTGAWKVVIRATGVTTELEALQADVAANAALVDADKVSAQNAATAAAGSQASAATAASNAASSATSATNQPAPPCAG